MGKRSSRRTWNLIKHDFEHGETLGSRQMWGLYLHIDKDWTPDTCGGNYGRYGFNGVLKSLVKRGLVEPYVLDHSQDCEFYRISEEGLKEFIRNGGDKIYEGRPNAVKGMIKDLLVRSGWVEREEWAKYLALDYLPAA